LLEIKLITGRHHQIRCQLAASGMPVKGDLKYGARRSNPDGSISLHAHRLEFIHPIRNVPVVIEVPPVFFKGTL
jgi:23S rRNA pseudouridine1911/1915/1917 synthase